MLIELSKIHPSPHPIRSTWDEQKMNDLSWSLREEGQVEPIGVHENGSGYVIVWGHRRVEAARRAQWTEIEAVIVPSNEIDNLIQAGIENLASEEMSADDKAEWVYRLTELGMSQREISRRSTVPLPTINSWFIYRQEKTAGVYIDVHLDDPRDEGISKVIAIQQVLGNDLEAKKIIAEKTSNDRLSKSQARSVAEAYRDAPTPEVKAQILKTPIISRDTAADILRRASHKIELDSTETSINKFAEWDQEQEERRMMREYDRAVGEFLEATRTYAEIARRGTDLIRLNKYSPEAAKFAIRKIDNLIGILKTYREELEGIQ